MRGDATTSPAPAGSEQPLAGRDVMMVVAHSDDEVLFAGGQMAGMRRLCVVHTTDSAPSRSLAAQRGFASRRAYALARAAELRAALAAGGIEAECINLGYRDSALCLHVGAAVRRLAQLIDARKPEVVLTQAYDGGHIDHDTTAAIVQFALERCAHRPAVWEMGGYYVAGGEWVMQRLLPRAVDEAMVVSLNDAERARKTAMLGHFGSQQHLIRQLPIGTEELREVLRYNFALAPMPGRLAYDVGGGADSAVWRVLVGARERRNRGVLLAGTQLLGAWIAMWLLVATRRQRRLRPRLGQPVEWLCRAAAGVASIPP